MSIGRRRLGIARLVACMKLLLQLSLILGIGHPPTDISSLRVAYQTRLSHPALRLVIPDMIRPAVPSRDRFIEELLVGICTPFCRQIFAGQLPLQGKKPQSTIDVELPVPHLGEGRAG